jgi:cytochrome c2
MGKPKKTRKQAQDEHVMLQRMGLSAYATEVTQKASEEHQGHKLFSKCPACKRRNRAYEITE